MTKDQPVEHPDRRAAAPGRPRSRAMFFSVVGRYLDNLQHFVRHQLAYAQAVGDLRPGELDTEDVVDAILLRAYREFVKTPPAAPLRRWLFGLAREQVATEIQRQKAWRERTPLRTEHDVPETPPEEAVSTLGDEILDFYEPDEDLKLEDVIADMFVMTPEKEAETRELRWCVDAALAGMPQAWRQAVQLRYVDGRGVAEIAKTLGVPEGEARRLLEHASQYLRQRLVESGCVLKARNEEAHG
jgi:RNA polymerase sigma factor (sigma-70 family)